MGTKADEYELTPQDTAEILAGTLQLLQENGLAVSVKNARRIENRPPGLLIFVSGVGVAGDGNLAALEES
ncbi:MAG: hypothetical protein IPM39_23435 [Chloroflexi bacterium]|nr:hypothetical protein [Chloroflexota bacterium]